MGDAAAHDYASLIGSRLRRANAQEAELARSGPTIDEPGVERLGVLLASNAIEMEAK